MGPRSRKRSKVDNSHDGTDRKVKQAAAHDRASVEPKQWCLVSPRSQHICIFVMVLKPKNIFVKKRAKGDGKKERISGIYTYKHIHTVHLHAAVFKRMTNEKKREDRLLKQTLHF